MKIRIKGSFIIAYVDVKQNLLDAYNNTLNQAKLDLVAKIAANTASLNTTSNATASTNATAPAAAKKSMILRKNK